MIDAPRSASVFTQSDWLATRRMVRLRTLLVRERGIEPHIPVFDHQSVSFQRSEFRYDHDLYICPGGKELHRHRRDYSTPRSVVDKDGFMRYRAGKRGYEACAPKAQCCPFFQRDRCFAVVHRPSAESDGRHRDAVRELNAFHLHASSRFRNSSATQREDRL